MRDMLLAVIVAVLCLAAPLFPKVGVLGYVWFAVMRPDLLAFSRGRPYSFVLGIAAVVGSLRHFPEITRLFRNPISLAFLALQLPIAISVLLAVNVDISLPSYYLYLRILTICLLIPVVLSTEADLRKLIMVIALSLGVLGMKFGVWGALAGGARYSSGYGGFLGDNNTFCLAMAMVFPLCWYGRQMTTFKPLRLTLLGMTFILPITIVLSFSRGSALSLAMAVLVIVLYSKYKVAVGLAVAALLSVSLLFVGGAYYERLSTITAPTEESSARGRIVYAQAGIKMWRDYPITGVGFGGANQQMLLTRYLPEEFGEDAHVLHNTYLQMLVDSGAIAFVIYLGLLFGTIVFLGRSARQIQKTHPAYAVYPRALQASLLAFAVGSTFLSRVTFDLTYMLLMASAIWYDVYARLRQPVAIEPVTAGSSPAAVTVSSRGEYSSASRI